MYFIKWIETFNVVAIISIAYSLLCGFEIDIPGTSPSPLEFIFRAKVFFARENKKLEINSKREV